MSLMTIRNGEIKANESPKSSGGGSLALPLSLPTSLLLLLSANRTLVYLKQTPTLSNC